MRQFGVLLPLLFLIGCATATITAYRDPAMSSRAYKSVCIFYPIDNLQLRAMVEEKAAESFRIKKIKAVPATLVYSPARNFEATEFVSTLKKNGVETLLLVRDANTFSSTVYGPVVTNFSGSAMGNGMGGASFSGSAVTTQSSHTVYSSQANIELWDLATMQRVWVAAVNGNSGNYGQELAIFNASYDQTVAKMIATTRDELIKGALFEVGASPRTKN